MSKYTLEAKPENKRNKFYVTIVADSNDGDYITTDAVHSKESFEEYVIDGLIHLKENGTGSHKLTNYDNKYNLDIPFNGWDGFCHTLTAVAVEYIDEKGILWNVKY